MATCTVSTRESTQSLDNSTVVGPTSILKRREDRRIIIIYLRYKLGVLPKLGNCTESTNLPVNEKAWTVIKAAVLVCKIKVGLASMQCCICCTFAR